MNWDIWLSSLLALIQKKKIFQQVRIISIQRDSKNNLLSFSFELWQMKISQQFTNNNVNDCLMT